MSHHVTICEVVCDVENSTFEIGLNPLVVRVQRCFGFDEIATDVTKCHILLDFLSTSVEASDVELTAPTESASHYASISASNFI